MSGPGRSLVLGSPRELGTVGLVSGSAARTPPS